MSEELTRRRFFGAGAAAGVGAAIGTQPGVARAAGSSPAGAAPSNDLRSSDCSTALFRPDVDPKDIRNIDNGYTEGGVAISLSAKTYAGARMAIVSNAMPTSNNKFASNPDFVLDFRITCWDYETKTLRATTDNLAATLNGLPRGSAFDRGLGYLLEADFLEPLSLAEAEWVILGTALYGDYPCRNIGNASVNAFKPLMGLDPQLGFNNKSAVDPATGPNDPRPRGGYEGGIPGPVGGDVSGNYPWVDLV